MDEALRTLANEYGYDAIQKRLRVLATEDLEVARCKVVQLESFLEDVEPAAPAPQPEMKTITVSAKAAEPTQESALEVATPQEQQPQRIVRKIVKKSQIKPPPSPTSQPTNTLTVLVEKDPEIKQIIVEVEQSVQTQQPSKFRDPKEVKAWQRAEEEKKKAELRSKGLRSKDILTRDNLAKWLSEGYTYARIAREEGGCTEQLVSQIARGYGLASSKGR
jgi:hypothetical protein